MPLNSSKHKEKIKEKLNIWKQAQMAKEDTVMQVVTFTKK